MKKPQSPALAEPSRDIPADVRRAVEVEAGHRCAIPTCRHGHYDLHHITEYAKGGLHIKENLIALCKNCHDRVHRGEIDRKSLIAYKKQLQDLLHVKDQAAASPGGGHPPERISYWKSKLSDWVGARVIVRDVEYDNYPNAGDPPNYPPDRPSAWFRVDLWELADEGMVFASAAGASLLLLTWRCVESVSFKRDEYYGEPSIMYRYNPDGYFEVGSYL